MTCPRRSIAPWFAETNKGLPELHRYFELRRRLLKLPDMAYYDIYPPLVSLDRKVTIPEMRAVVLEAVKPLAPIMSRCWARRRRANGWIRCRVRASARAPI